MIVNARSFMMIVQHCGASLFEDSMITVAISKYGIAPYTNARAILERRQSNAAAGRVDKTVRYL